MDRLPEELVLQIFAYLDERDLVSCQLIDNRYLNIARDSRLWKQHCFKRSPAEAARRRQQLFIDADARITALRQAIAGVPPQQSSSSSIQSSINAQRAIFDDLERWDPGCPDESLDFYAEYIHRHAPIPPPSWLNLPMERGSFEHEATGIGTIQGSDGSVRNILAPLDDGSICMWDVAADLEHYPSKTIRIAAQSQKGLLSGSHSHYGRGATVLDSKLIMTEAGTLERVSVDSMDKSGLFAVQDRIQKIDLSTLQLVSTHKYDSTVMALSDSLPDIPITVGTSSMIHLYDPRAPQSKAADLSLRCELISGPASYATLTQPGPLSILHQQHGDEGSIWVAGRFTHLLNYDRRFFPQLKGTVHSGARISSLASLPYTYGNTQPQNKVHGMTLAAAGVYKGKGSLELYNLSASGDPVLHESSLRNAIAPPSVVSKYQNRQTASTSKLLSVLPHGGTLAVTDSDGEIKWFERDGKYKIRSFNVNPAPSSELDRRTRSALAYGSEVPSFNQAQTQAQSVFEGSGDRDLPGRGDIVQKILPFHSLTGSCSGKDLTNPLLMWTGDGRIGILGFGHRPPAVHVRMPGELDDDEDEGYVSSFSASSHSSGREQCERGDENHGMTIDEQEERLRVRARRAECRAREDAERQYAGSMRRALENQASEARFMRGLGLG